LGSIKITVAVSFEDTCNERPVGIHIRNVYPGLLARTSVITDGKTPTDLPNLTFVLTKISAS
jgi:hypothetical protein